MSRKVKEKIDKAIGKHKYFTDHDKRAIYAKIEQKGKRKNKIPVIFAYTLAATLLFVFGWLGVQNHFGKTPQRHSLSVSAQNPGKAQHRDKIRNDKSFRNYVNVFLGKKHPDQFRIVKKMYYSLDHIQNAQGEFVWGHPGHHEMEHERFYVDFVHKKSLLKSEDLKNGKVIQTLNLMFKNGMSVSELPAKRIFVKRPVKPNDTLGYLLKAGGEVTESSWFSLISNDYSQWHYQIGTKFGMPVYEIKGIDPLGHSFSMTVSKDTGALLDLKRYEKNNKNKLAFYITVKNIKINQGVPNSTFRLHISGDKAVSWKVFDSNTIGGQAYKGKKICGQNCVESHS